MYVSGMMYNGGSSIVPTKVSLLLGKLCEIVLTLDQLKRRGESLLIDAPFVLLKKRLIDQIFIHCSKSGSCGRN